MTTDDIINMAREAGWPEWDIVGCEIELERFAALVAAAEREECAKVCEVLEYNGYERLPRDPVSARRIRARGQA
jgi:hypothetical protein